MKFQPKSYRKQKAQDAIDKLNNLNEAQKAAAKAAVDNATDAAGVNAASDQATALDGNMGDLKESVADVDATKVSVNYTNADEAAQKAYDAAVEAANAIVAKEGTNADSTAVQAALEKVKETKAALNGDKKLKDAKQAAQDAIDKLNNLNDEQKAAAKVAVNNATDAAGVTAASDQATALDGYNCVCCFYCCVICLLCFFIGVLVVSACLCCISICYGFLQVTHVAI